MLRKQSFPIPAGIALALLLGLIASLALAATVTIDTFDDGVQKATAGPNADNSNSSYVDTSAALGGQRDIYVYNSSGGGDVSLAVDYGDTNQAKFSQDSGVQGWGQIVWDGQDNNAESLDTTGLGGVDLTDSGTNDGFQLLVYYCDGGFDLGVWVYTDTVTAYYTLTISSSVAAPGQSFFLKFSDFSGDTSVFTDAGAVVFNISPSAASVDLTIDLFEATAQTDWGDLPDTYRTSSAQDGPRHVKDNLYLGPNIDTEADGFPSVDATGDDNNNLDDEDGIVRVPNDVWQPGNTVHITATVTGGTGDLYGWFDWDDDGDFSDETPTSWTGLTAGEHRLSLTVPSGFDPSNGLAARFRLVPQGTTPNYYGEVTNGEVEDYMWAFSPTAVTLSRLEAKPSAQVWLAALTAASLLGAGGLGLIMVRRRG